MSLWDKWKKAASDAAWKGARSPYGLPIPIAYGVTWVEGIQVYAGAQFTWYGDSPIDPGRAMLANKYEVDSDTGAVAVNVKGTAAQSAVIVLCEEATDVLDILKDGVSVIQTGVTTTAHRLAAIGAHTLAPNIIPPTGEDVGYFHGGTGAATAHTRFSRTASLGPAPYTYSTVARVDFCALAIGGIGMRPVLKFKVQGELAASSSVGADPVDVLVDLWARAGMTSALDVTTYYQAYCDSGGGSGTDQWIINRSIDSQTSARDLIDSLLLETFSTAVTLEDGSVLIVPRDVGEVTATAIGVDDFVVDGGSDPIVVERKQDTDCFNCIQVKYQVTTDSGTHDVTNEDTTFAVANPSPYGISGIHRGPAVNCSWVSTAEHALNLSHLLAQEEFTVRRTFKFRLHPRWVLLQVGMILSLTEPILGCSGQACRITSLSEGSDGVIECEAQEWFGQIAYTTPAVDPTDGFGGTLPGIPADPNEGTLQNEYYQVLQWIRSLEVAGVMASGDKPAFGALISDRLFKDWQEVVRAALPFVSITVPKGANNPTVQAAFDVLFENVDLGAGIVTVGAWPALNNYMIATAAVPPTAATSATGLGWPSGSWTPDLSTWITTDCNLFEHLLSSKFWAVIVGLDNLRQALRTGVGGETISTLAGGHTVTAYGTSTPKALADWTADVVSLSSMESRISVKDAPFSAVGDGTHDDTTHIQAALDYAVANDVKYVYFPAGEYLISDSLVLVKFAAGAFSYQGVSLVGDGTGDNGTPNVKIIQTNPDQAGLLVQKWYGGFIEGIAIHGAATHIASVSMNQMVEGTADWFGACRSNRYSPHAGIVVDPFTSRAAGDQYPDKSSYYVAGANGSHHFAIRNCDIRQWIVGALISPNATSYNGENCDFDFNIVWQCHTALAVGQSQALSVFVRNMEAWVGIHTVISCDVWGSGVGAFPRVEGLNVAGGTYQLFSYDFGWAGKSGIEVKGLHAESFYSLGNATGMTLIEPTLHFANYAGIGTRRASSQGSIAGARFIGGHIGQYIAIENFMSFYGLSTASFIGTQVDGMMIDNLLYPDGEQESVLEIHRVSYLYDLYSTGPVSSPGLIRAAGYTAAIQHNRFYDGMEWALTFANFKRWRARATTPRLRFDSLGNKLISNPAAATGTFNLLSSTNPVLDLSHVALVLPGMWVQVRGFAAHAGQVTAVDYGTGDVTMNILDGAMMTYGDDTYNIAFRDEVTDAYLSGMPTQALPVIIHPSAQGSTPVVGQISQIAIDTSPMLLSFVHTDASRYIRVGDAIYCYLHAAGGFEGLAGQVHSLDGDTVYVKDQAVGITDGSTQALYVVHERRFMPLTVASLTSGSADITVTNSSAINLNGYKAGLRLYGTGIPAGAYITANASYPVLTMSAPATATVSSWLSDAELDWDLEGSAIPTTYFFKRGTFVKNSGAAVTGTAPNTRALLGWVKVTDDPTNVLDTDWVPVYGGTGAGMTQGAAVADGSTVDQLLTSLRAAGLIAT